MSGRDRKKFGMFPVSQNTLVLVISGVCLQFMKVVFDTEGFGEYLNF